MAAEQGEGKKLRLLETRPRVLAQFFQKSRDQWKLKCQQARGEVRAFRVRTRDLEESRAKWREAAEQSAQEQERLREENARLREQLARYEANHEVKIAAAG